jgi:hypothetical protein
MKKGLVFINFRFAGNIKQYLVFHFPDFDDPARFLGESAQALDKITYL